MEATLENDIFTDNLKLAEANLNVIKVNLNNAETTFKRTEKLLKKDSVSRQEYDNDKFTLNKIKAQFEAEKAKVRIAKTTLNDANLYSPANAFVMIRAFEIGSMLLQNQL